MVKRMIGDQAPPAPFYIARLAEARRGQLSYSPTGIVCQRSIVTRRYGASPCNSFLLKVKTLLAGLGQAHNLLLLSQHSVEFRKGGRVGEVAAKKVDHVVMHGEPYRPRGLQ